MSQGLIEFFFFRDKVFLGEILRLPRVVNLLFRRVGERFTGLLHDEFLARLGSVRTQSLCLPALSRKVAWLRSMGGLSGSA